MLRLPEDARVRIARFLSVRAVSHEDTADLVRRQSLERELEQLGKQHRWSVIADDEFLVCSMHSRSSRPLTHRKRTLRSSRMRVRSGRAHPTNGADASSGRCFTRCVSRPIALSVRPPYRELVYAALGPALWS
jgi:hypothetical protein